MEKVGRSMAVKLDLSSLAAYYFSFKLAVTSLESILQLFVKVFTTSCSAPLLLAPLGI